MRKLIVLCIISIFFLFLTDRIFANPPHRTNWTADTNKLVYCNSCHVVHNASAPGLTRDINAALCMSCHTSTSPAAPEKAFVSSEQAAPGTGGTSHRWDAYLPTTDSPDNTYGLRSVGSLSNTALKNAALLFKDSVTGAGGVTCSTCHQQHSQALTPWDPLYGPANNTPSVYSGTATAGDTTTIIDSTKSWTGIDWSNSLVVISGPTSSANYNKERRVVSSTINTLTVSPAFPQAVAAGETYSITSGRHYQRMNDTEDTTANDMCIDCHYYRATSSATDVRTYDGNKKSHPVSKNLSQYNAGTNPDGVQDATQFVGAAPFEPSSASWAAQTGTPRYAGNGGSDNNTTNNIVLDSNSRVRCLSCHGIHYSDSDSSTEDRSHDDRMP